MEKKIIPLMNTGENTEGENLLPEVWEKIQNARLTGHDDYLRYKKRNGLDKKSNCPISDSYLIDSYKDTIFSIGSGSTSIYNKSSDEWNTPINTKREYEQDTTILNIIEDDFPTNTLQASSSQIIEHNGYVYHAYLKKDLFVYIDLLDDDYNFIKTIFKYTFLSFSGTHNQAFFMYVHNNRITVVINRVETGGFMRHYYIVPSENTVDKTTTDDWAASTTYALSDKVVYNGRLYNCTTAHTSTGSFDYDKFTPYLYPDELFSDPTQWSSSSVEYRVGDLVYVLGALPGQKTIYVCTKDHTSTVSFVNFSAVIDYATDSNFLASSFAGVITAKQMHGETYIGLLYSDAGVANIYFSVLTIDSAYSFTSKNTGAMDTLGSIYDYTVDIGIDVDFYEGASDTDSRLIATRVRVANSVPSYGNMTAYTATARIDSIVTANKSSLVINTGSSSHWLTVSPTSAIPDQTNVIVSPINSSIFCVAVNYSDFRGFRTYFFNISDATKSHVGYNHHNIYALSKVFVDDSNYYCFAKTPNYVGAAIGVDLYPNPDPTNNRVYLVKITIEDTNSAIEGSSIKNTSNAKSIYPVATFAYGGNVPQGRYFFYQTGRKVKFPYFVPQTLRSISRQIYELFSVDFSTTLKPQATEAFGSLFIAGNILKEFDGMALSENNFFEGPKIRLSSSTGGANTYKYYAIFTHVNSKGDKTRSRVSNLSTVTSVAAPNSNPITIEISCCTLTAKENVSIELYRTAAGGSTFYKVGTALSVFSSGVITIADTIADTEFTSTNDEGFRHPLIYHDKTTGAILENENIGGVKNMVVHNGRIFAQSIVDGVTYYSKGKTTGEAVSFSTYLSIDTSAPDLNYESGNTVGSAGITFGDVGALASNYGWLVMFSNRSIFGITGDGADIVGANSTFSEPETIHDSQGCSNPQTIVNTPLGIIFKGTDSWYLLNGRTLTDIGDNIANYYDNEVKSSAVSLKEGLVYYLVETSERIVLVYDYKNGGQWYEYKFGVSDIADMTVIDGKLAVIKAASIDNFFVEGTGHKDNSVHYDMVFRSGHLQLSHIQGFKRLSRLMILGRAKTLGFNYQLKEYGDNKVTDTAWVTGVSYSVSELVEQDGFIYECIVAHTSGAFATDLSAKKWVQVSITKTGINGGRQTDIHITKQKTDSFKFELSVIPETSDSGETIEIENMSLLVGMKPYRAKVGTNNRG